MFDSSEHIGQRRLGRLTAAGLVFVVLGLVWLLAGRSGERSALALVDDQAAASLPLAVSVLRSEVDKQRSVPAILAEDPEIRDLLLRPRPEAAARVNGRLEQLRRTTGATVLYLLDATGLTIAASNYAEPTSFVGSDYSFRPYFRQALAEGAGAQYALGTVSRRPGLYITRRVDGGGRPLGVVVLKMEFDGVERDWALAGNTVFVSDERGIVLATTRPEWRYRTLAPVPTDLKAQIRDSLQFGAAPLTPLPLEADDGAVRLDEGARGERFAVAEQRLDDAVLSWTLHLWVPAEGAIRQGMRNARLQASSVALILGTLGFLLLRRRRNLRRRQADLHAASLELERRVEMRTRELRETNARLRNESRTRAAAEERVEALRRDLEQANRLASLGQITAGVAHEINQPVAAIRTYAENAERFLERRDEAAVSRNLSEVVGLTERIGRITDTLKGHARRGSGPLDTVNLDEAVEGAVMVLQGRPDAGGVAMERGSELAGIAVRAERIRLEQVLVNLIQNAMDALEGRDKGRIVVTAARDGERVRLDVEDNGPGIPEDRMATLFTPFSTTKPRGLGLGLVIAKDIVSEWGGSLAASNRPGGGAVFSVELEVAT